MRRLLVAGAVVACSCGRIDFGDLAARGDGGGVLGDGNRPSTDATDAPPAPACSPDRLLCDPFDDGPLDTTMWNLVDGAMELDTAIKHRGTASLRFDMPLTVPFTEYGAYIGHQGPAVQNATVLYLRAWVRLDSLPQAPNALELMAVLQTNGDGVYIFARANQLQVYHQEDDKVDSTPAAPPLNTWFCLLWELRLETTATGSSRVTSDLLPALEIQSSVTQTVPTQDLITFGPYYAPSNNDVGSPAFSYWYDDVLVDDEPITCDD